tara:strand:- start:63 stop:368 length:306 start_codon:yes stop_codon:yes gene_type:complete
MDNFKFKDVEMTFDYRKLAHYDQEYLRTMTFETINDRSVNQDGIPFIDCYPYADNFTMFSNQDEMLNHMADFNSHTDSTASHLLHNKKYWLAWTYSSDDEE